MKQLRGTPLKRFLRGLQPPSPTELVIVCQSVAYPVNVGSIFRIADALDVTEVVLTGITPTPPNAVIEKVGRYKSSRVPWRYEKDPRTAVNDLKASGYHVVAVELCEGALPYHEYCYPQKTCLVVGHEDHGVTKATLEACDATVFLPMYGKGLSLNVHFALSIVVYHIIHSAHE